ncbi:MAG: MoxR family ATPase [Candidatus Ancillula sp.]|jgi:MoxR-like ATPase|nr:MoxR family ATPase [Candidatus Ancillula sp.]
MKEKDTRKAQRRSKGTARKSKSAFGESTAQNEGNVTSNDFPSDFPSGFNAQTLPSQRSQVPTNAPLTETSNTASPSNNAEKYVGGQVSHNDLQRAGDIIARIEDIFSQKIVGQDQMRIALLTTLIADGHILIESVPGLAKTTASETLCLAIHGKFSRVQCTPDLMPSDIVGSQIYNNSTGKFTTHLGPVHANLVLMDEINRSSAKTQSAMLEAMQERQTTIGEDTYQLPDQFMVIATQNPIEEEGTYVLPEAQMDRFLLKEIITYPSPEQEVQILENLISGKLSAPASGYLASLEDVKFLQDQAKRVYVSPAILHYITSLVFTTRGGGPNPIVGLDKLIRVGASPRASIAFVRACQALALLSRRSYVIPEDVKDMRYAVLRHRILRTFDAMAEGVNVETIIDQIFQVVPVP